MRFLDDRRMEIASNIAGREIGPIALNRKNALRGLGRWSPELGDRRLAQRNVQTH
jgi:hypothetical protein